MGDIRMLRLFLLGILFGFFINPMLRLLGNWVGYREGSWPMSATRAVMFTAMLHWLHKPFASRPEIIIQLIILFWLDLLLSRLFPINR